MVAPNERRRTTMSDAKLTWDGAQRPIKLVADYLTHRMAQYHVASNGFTFPDNDQARIAGFIGELSEDEQRNLVERQQSTKSNQEIAAELLLDVPDDMKVPRPKTLPTAVQRVGDLSRDHTLKQVCSAIMSCTGDDTELRRLCTAFFSPKLDYEERENAIAVIKQWLWLVKRNLAGLPELYHIMPIFWSKQGGGKSTTIFRLLEPLKTAWRKDNFALFADPFAALRMHYAYAIFLDEMAKVERAGAASLKEAVSNSHIPGRGMWSDAVRSKIRRASFIAATNEPPPHGLTDTRGARRFFSIRCRDEKPEGEIKAIFDSFNAVEIWRCVDHKGPAPLLHEAGRWAKVQDEQNKTVRATSLFEDFWTEYTAPATSDTRLGFSDIQRAYKAYLVDVRNINREPTPNHTVLREYLETLSCEVGSHANLFYAKGRVITGGPSA
jgi:hypothetical protein